MGIDDQPWHPREDEVGVALFIRHPGGVALTNAGKQFLNHARMVIGRIEYALKDAGAAGRGEDGCEIARLWEERVFVVLPEDHALIACDEIGWDDLRNQHFIVSETDAGPEIHDIS